MFLNQRFWRRNYC